MEGITKGTRHQVPEYVKNMPVKPHDQTSNQLWVDIQLHHESNAELLKETTKELKYRLNQPTTSHHSSIVFG